MCIPLGVCQGGILLRFCTCQLLGALASSFSDYIRSCCMLSSVCLPVLCVFAVHTAPPLWSSFVRRVYNRCSTLAVEAFSDAL